MNPEEIHRLIEEYRDGTISPADAERLAAAIRENGAAAKELAFSGHLAQALEDSDDASFARSFAERLSAERDRSEFVRAFEKRSRARVTARTRRIENRQPSMVPFLIAAGILLAIVGALLSQPKPAPTPGPEARHEEPIPIPEEPKPQAPLPEPPAPTPQEPPRVVIPAPPAPPPVKPEEPPPVAPALPEVPPKPAPLKGTEVARPWVAKLDRADGDVFIGTGADRHPATRGEEIPPGAGVAVGLKSSHAVLLLADGTRIGLIGADASIREITKGPRGTRVMLAQGTLTADAAKQAVDQPLVFATPHGEARVLGTVLRLVVDSASTRLEVKEGKVRLTRETKSVDVSAGQYAVAAAGATLATRSLSPDEIVLHAQQARVTGNEWTLVRDLKSLTGVVLEAGASPFKVIDHVEARPSYATFTFYAPADKEYRIWMRATSQEKGDSWTRDMVTIEPTRATLSQKSPFFGTAPTLAYVFTGVAATPGYTWLGGHGEEGKADLPPLTVKFAETGLQNLRVYVAHPWIRVDAIWLSATQKTRPPARQLAPLPEK